MNLLPAGVHKRGACHDLAIVLAAYAADGRVRNVEGPVFLAELGLDGALHRSPETVAMVMAAVDMINRYGAQLDEKTVRENLEGNICRCTGYHNIVKAILAAAQEMNAAGRQAA